MSIDINILRGGRKKEGEEEKENGERKNGGRREEGRRISNAKSRLHSAHPCAKESSTREESG